MTEAEMKAIILETLNQGLQIPFDKAEAWVEIKEWLHAAEEGNESENGIVQHPKAEKGRV